MAQQYNAPNGNPSDIGGSQVIVTAYVKKALMEAREIQYFMQLADVTNMPKNMGKSITVYHYIPLLDDANINSQGIDANGVTIDKDKYYITISNVSDSFAVEADATAAAAAVNAVTAASAVKSGSATPWVVTYGTTKMSTATLGLAQAISNAVPSAKYQRGSGNLYGSSKDIGTIVGKLPNIGENGGRVNRVGFTRKTLTGSIVNFGFFHEWTEDSLQFDTDAELEMHLQRELMNGAAEMTEDALQIDLLNSAGVIRYAGNAMSNATIGADDVVTYSDLMHLGITLDNNLSPKHTTVITGSRNQDTRTIPACRVLYIGSELLPTLKAMKDLHNNPAFIETHKYSDGLTPLKGEHGAIDNFRVVVVPKMLKWGNAGALATDDDYYAGDTRYDVFPMLTIGEKSFTTIGFQTDGKTVKFTTITKKPGAETADKLNPFGKEGFSSIQWWYGFLALRPERIGLVKTAAMM